MVKKSFSLIEVIVSLAVLGLIFSGMIFIFNQGFIWTSKTKEEKDALMLATQTLEFFSSWQNLVNLTGGDPPTNGSYTLSPITIDNITYQRTLTISNVALSSDLKRIVVNVRGRTKIINIASFVSKIE